MKALGLLAGCLLALMMSAPAQAAPPCDQAASLTAAGLPQQAVALLQDSGRSAVRACAPAYAEATALVANAQVLAQSASQALTLDQTEAAAELAEQALAADRLNAQATTVSAELAAAAKPSDTTWAQRLSKRIDATTTKYLAPAGKVLASILVVLAGLLLVARVLPFLIGDWPRLTMRPMALASGIAAGAASGWLLTAGMTGELVVGTRIALVVTLLALGTLTALIRNMVGAAAVFIMAVLGVLWLSLGLTVAVAMTGGVGAGFAAVVLVGWWLATRLRVSISAPEPDTAAHVAALLNDLGASPPRGLEVPSGADATELAGALESIPGAGSLLARLGQFVTALLGVTPWRVEVMEVEGDALTVRIKRNTHAVGSVVIAPTDARSGPAAKDARALDQQRMAAAFVLITLSQAHGPFPGLVGATGWRSLGLHYVATTDLSDESQRQTLARAVGLDPGNRLAQLAWQHSLWRRSDDPAELLAYQRWLASFVTELDGDSGAAAVRLRAAYTRTAVLLNMKAANEDYAAALEEFTHLLDTYPDGDEPVLQQFRDLLKSLPTTIDQPPPADDLPVTPRGLYNLACWCAQSQPERAIALLKRVEDLPLLRDWMALDPQLSALRDTDEYRAAFGRPPRDDFFALPPVGVVADTLKNAGYANPSTLAAGGAALIRLLDHPAPVIGLARMYMALEQQRRLSVEILLDLSDRGLTTEAAVRAVASAERDRLCANIATGVSGRCRPPGVTAAELRSWWDEHYPLHA